MSELNKESMLTCGHLKEKITGYWTKRAESFSNLRQGELHSNKYQRWEEEIKSQLPAGKPLKILDVGCGAGFFTIILARAGHQVTGIDLTAAMIEDARRLSFIELGENPPKGGGLTEAAPGLRQVPEAQRGETLLQAGTIDFQVMDAEKLTFAEAVFDVVISRNLTWNLPHPARAYAEWLRVLKPGGLLLNYDAEYAKDHHEHIRDNAHANIDPALLQECHQLYHMLDISLVKRPDWDEQVLKQLLCSKVEVAADIGRAIYREKDEFNITTPMFRIRALKNF